jgi:hypothetical protein
VNCRKQDYSRGKDAASGFPIDLIVRHTGLASSETESLIEGEIKDRREEKFDTAVY